MYVGLRICECASMDVGVSYCSWRSANHSIISFTLIIWYGIAKSVYIDLWKSHVVQVVIQSKKNEDFLVVRLLQ